MYLNRFSVRVPEGSEKTSGYVEIEHGKQYTIVLRNDHSVRCNAEIGIDGKNVGTFRIAANSTMRLERKPDDDGRFTFYRLGSEESAKSDLGNVSASELGLLKIVFTPETKPRTIIGKYWPSPMWADDENWDYTTTTTTRGSSMCSTTVYNCATQDCAPGGTGLSGHSDQGFVNVGDICLDYSQQTTIHLRLVETRKQEDPRPLKPVMNSSPIPPPV